MKVGYYVFNTDWKQSLARYFEIEKAPIAPISKLMIIPFTITNPRYGLYNMQIQLYNFQKETKDGKLIFSFPAGYTYTGTIKVQLYAR